MLKYKFLYSFLFLVLLFSISYTSAELKTNLNVHYYSNGEEILVYSDDTFFDGISFEVIGTNIMNDTRLLDIKIINATPIEFYNALPKDISETLRIAQEKTLWVSKIIDLKKFTDGEKINFTLETYGMIENDILTDSFTSKEIIINNDTNDFLYNIGKEIMPSNPYLGIFIVLGLIGLFLYFFIFKANLSDRVNNYKIRLKRKREERERENL